MVDQRASQSDIFNPYENPDLAQWLGSFEVVPDAWVQAAAKKPREGPASVSQRLYACLDRFGQLLPGIGLASLLALGGMVGIPPHWNHTAQPRSKSRKLHQRRHHSWLGPSQRCWIAPPVFEEGVRFCDKRVLRIGIVLIGLKLSLSSLGKLGLAVLPIVGACIQASLFFVKVASRTAGIPARLGTLIAVGTSICGVSAIVATAQAIKAEDEEVSCAVASITLFGTAALFLYPMLATHLFVGSGLHTELFLGTAIQDTSQVAAAAIMHEQLAGSQTTLETAAATKLLRNLFMTVVIPLMVIRHCPDAVRNKETSDNRSLQAAPLFVVGFVTWTACAR